MENADGIEVKKIFRLISADQAILVVVVDAKQRP
jgi:hypothetical protein